MLRLWLGRWGVWGGDGAIRSWVTPDHSQIRVGNLKLELYIILRVSSYHDYDSLSAEVFVIRSMFNCDCEIEGGGG